MPPGTEKINNIPVRRFPVDYERDPNSFRKLTDEILSPSSGLERRSEAEERSSPSAAAVEPARIDRLEQWMRAQGPYSSQLKNRLLKNALAPVMPSFYESLSLVLLESWSLGVPVLVNGRCEALKGQISRSGGGLTYTDIRTFAQQATALIASPALRCTLGLRGQRYVRQTYTWPKIEEAYLSALSACLPRFPRVL